MFTLVHSSGVGVKFGSNLVHVVVEWPLIPIYSCVTVTTLELVSKELNHLAAILHVYAGGLNSMK